MSLPPMPPQLPPSVPPRAAPAQDGRISFLGPAVDTGGPRTVPVTRPGAQAEQSVQPPSHPLAGHPGSRPQQVAAPQQPVAEPRPVEPSAGVVAEAVAEAAPTHPEPATEGPRRATWIGWVLAVVLVAVAAAVSYAAFGLAPVVISTAVPLVVAEAGLVLLLLALAATVIRRRLRLAEQQGRGQAQEEAWSRHQQFLRRLDHELKNPLTAVRAAVADLPQAPPHELQARVDVVDAQARRMGRLVTDLRKLADLETAALSLEDVDIAETVHDAAQAVGEEGAARGGGPKIRLDLPQVPWPLSHVRGDGDLLYSAVYNVISNASKYTQPGGTVEVRGREESGTVTIEVADTGIGVPQADLPAVWSELARAGNARGLPGSGLGLALVSTIVRRHGGSVRMASREGVGTRVWLSLPVAGPPDMS
ncbi:sensor histidine kinase [Actinomyces oris]|uniref:sensor histidine kinase n=1 Tax=Actinomyces oris TaxID=544580 RepID=UPI000AE7D4CF|nr:HAMP domain-containing sensor histidine kinase [Actinomyces oris]